MNTKKKQQKISSPDCTHHCTMYFNPNDYKVSDQYTNISSTTNINNVVHWQRGWIVMISLHCWWNMVRRRGCELCETESMDYMNIMHVWVSGYMEYG